MNFTLLKAIIVFIAVTLLFLWSKTLHSKKKSKWSLLQMLGAGFLVIVTLTHICEALNLFSFMRWGRPDSVGHYLDFSSAILGLTLFPIGYLGSLLHKKRLK